jgi:hypothetical protein
VDNSKDLILESDKIREAIWHEARDSLKEEFERYTLFLDTKVEWVDRRYESMCKEKNIKPWG